MLPKAYRRLAYVPAFDLCHLAHCLQEPQHSHLSCAQLHEVYTMAMSAGDVDRMLKQMLLKDQRILCRAKGLSPAGGKEQLTERLTEYMLKTGDL